MTDTPKHDPTFPGADVLGAWSPSSPRPELADRIMAALEVAPPLLPAPPRSLLALALPAAGAAAVCMAGFWLVLADGGTAADPDPTPGPSVVVAPTKAEPPQPDTRKATLVVIVEPRDAKVVVDGRSFTGGSPYAITNLYVGDHRVTVERAQYLSFDRTIDIPEGTLNLPIDLELETVTLGVDSDPRNATVRIYEGAREAFSGGSSDRFLIARQPGAAYTIEASAPGHFARRIPIEFTGDAHQSVRVVLVRDSSRKPARPTKKPQQASAAKTGVLKIAPARGYPSANITVDGKYVGKTPVLRYRVVPGSHRVKCTWPDGHASSMTVAIGDQSAKLVKCRR